MYDKVLIRIPGVQTRNCVFVLLVALLLSTATGYAHGNISGEKASSDVTDKAGPGLDAARAYIIAEDFSNAVRTYASLIQRDTSGVLLNAEYAYALALNGIYDAALARLDRIWVTNSGSSEVNFFASQVFALMGYDMLAIEFGQKISAGSAPAWIASAAPEFLEKYSDRMPGDKMSEGGDVVTDFRRANRLTAQNYNLMSIGMFEGIIARYPGEYLPYVGSSIALEKAGMHEKSAQAIEQALAILGDDTENQEARQALENRLAEIKGKSAAGAKRSNTIIPAAAGPDAKGRRMLAYAGGMLSSSYVSLTGRVGTFISGAGSISADLGVTQSGGGTSLTIGAMNFFRQKIFAGGYGVGVGFGGGSTTLNIKLSVGFSIMNKDNNASWDIFLDGQQPVAPKGSATTVGFSIGRSVYFGSR
jgi:hypothetical protein